MHATAIKPAAGVDFLVAPRRRMLDNLILNAAAADGAEVRLGIWVDDVTRDDDGRVTGVAGRAADGTTVAVRARLVIGADGMRSRIARAVDAPILDELVTDTGGYFTYFDSIPWDGFEFYIADRAFTGVFPTNHGAACVWVVASGDEIEAIRAEHGADEVGFHQLVRRTAPDLADRLGDARRVDRMRLALRYPSFVRHPFGLGWALAGDAGYYRDAITGHGITDAFRDAELLAAAVGGWLRGGRPETVAMHRYAIERDVALRPIFEVTNALARWPGSEKFFGLQKDLNELLDVEAEQSFLGAPAAGVNLDGGVIDPPHPTALTPLVEARNEQRRQPPVRNEVGVHTPFVTLDAVQEILGGTSNRRDTRPIFLKEKCDMNKTYLDSELATLPAVSTVEIITPSTKAVTGRIADHDQQVESARVISPEISQREPLSAAHKARPWYQRLLEIAAQNPPHLF